MSAPKKKFEINRLRMVEISLRVVGYNQYKTTKFEARKY